MAQPVEREAIAGLNVSGPRSHSSTAGDLSGVLVAAPLAGCATTTTATSILVGRDPNAIAITPDGTTAYVVNSFQDDVTPINLASKAPGTTIPVGFDAGDIAISPDGNTAYVIHADNSATCKAIWSACNTMTLINLATKARGLEFKVGSSPAAIAITPNGATAYVVNSNPQGPLSNVTAPADAIGVMPINLATGTPGTLILGPFGKGFQDPVAIALTPDGRRAYVVNYVNDSVTPIDLASKAAGPPISVGAAPVAIAITPDGATAFVVNSSDDSVTPINLATNTPGAAIRAGHGPIAIAITGNGRTAYVVDYNDNSVTPINLATKTPGAVIPVGHGPDAIAITPKGTTAYVANSFDNSVTLINLR